MKAWALGEHPTGKNALDVAVELDLVHLDEGGGVGRLGRRPRIANTRRHLQRAKLHRLVDWDLEMRDTARDLVESGEHGDLVLDLLGVGKRAAAEHSRRGNT